MSVSHRSVFIGSFLVILCIGSTPVFSVGPRSRISAMGADGDKAAQALKAAVAFNPLANEVFAVWCGDDQSRPWRTVNSRSGANA